MTNYLWRMIDALAVDPVTLDEIHFVEGQYFRRVAETGHKVEVEADEARAEIAAIAEQRRVLAEREVAEDARRAEAAREEALAEEALAAAIRAAHPGASNDAVARFVARYGSAWTVEPGYGPYDGYGDGADQRLAGLLASCE
jgi:hypothetical protein